MRTPPNKCFFLIGMVLAFLAVALGSFGAHGLKEKMDAEILKIFETGVRYQMYHALAFLMLDWAREKYGHPWVSVAGWVLLIGTVIFSGSLYMLAVTGVRAWGAITPIGGIFLLIGWMSMTVGVIKGNGR